MWGGADPTGGPEGRGAERGGAGAEAVGGAAVPGVRPAAATRGPRTVRSRERGRRLLTTENTNTFITAINDQSIKSV